VSCVGDEMSAKRWRVEGIGQLEKSFQGARRVQTLLVREPGLASTIAKTTGCTPQTGFCSMLFSPSVTDELYPPGVLGAHGAGSCRERSALAIMLPGRTR
jgi:hypothetical protein